MCLDNSSNLQTPNNKAIWGYRVFVKRDRKLFTLHSEMPLKKGSWLKADKLRIWGSHKDGFYGFETRRGTAGWTDKPHVILRVKFRQIHTRGTAFGSPAFVASEMFIPKSAKPMKERDCDI